jgi:16S rRNA G966 N2-methylase RsmD
MSAELYVKRASRSFDLIFLDPPFPWQYKWALLANIAVSRIISKETRIIIHRPKEDVQIKDIPLLEKTDSRSYGRSVVDFFAYRNPS